LVIFVNEAVEIWSNLSSYILSSTTSKLPESGLAVEAQEAANR